MRHFKAAGDHITARFDGVESEILTGFFGQVRAILYERAVETGQSPTHVDRADDAESLFASLEQQTRPLPPPDDPAIARLLPSGRRDETPSAGESAIEFRRLTERDLRAGKIEDAERAASLIIDGGELSLDDATVLLRAINDVRLSLGARLKVDEDTQIPRKIRTEQDQALAVYFWTGGLQEELVEAIVDVDDDL